MINKLIPKAKNDSKNFEKEPKKPILRIDLHFLNGKQVLHLHILSKKKKYYIIAENKLIVEILKPIKKAWDKIKRKHCKKHIQTKHNKLE
jgi:hypothetical protein